MIRTVVGLGSRMRRNVSCEINDSWRMFSGHQWHQLIINLRLM